MPTDSIFHTIVIDTDEKADKFIAALEEASKHPYYEFTIERNAQLTDIDEIRKLFGKKE